MSLKAFHIVFVIASLALSTWFAVWCFNEGALAGGSSALVMGTIALITSFTLAIYLAWIIRKMRRLPQALALALFLSVKPSSAWACAVCFGPANSAMVQSANTGILFLLGVVGTVLVGFASLFITWLVRAKKLEALNIAA